MDMQQLITWMKKHSEKYSVVLGIDGYVRSPKFDAYFTKYYSKYFFERVALIVMILLSEDDGKIYLSGKEYNYHKSGLEKLAEDIKNIYDGSEVMEIIFTRRIDDDIEYPDLERTYQYLLRINNLTDTAFYNLPSKKKDYIKELVGKMNLSLI